MTRFFGRLGLLVLGTIGGLAAVELTLRLLPPPASSHDLRALHELRPDRPWLFGMRPGADVRGPGGVRYTVNADSFRDRSYARPKPPGAFRIVVLGHSTAFGWGVPLEETFPKVLETRLAALASRETPIEVLNLGVCGYNPYTEAALFADLGVTYQPDLVLVQFGINDLNDPTLHFDAQTTIRLGVIPDAAFPNPGQRRSPPPPSLAERACRASRVCSLILDHKRQQLPDPFLFQASLATHDDPSAVELAWLRARYVDIARTASSIGARFVVVVFPYATQVDGRVAPRVQERLAAMGREAGWPVIDLLPAFQAAARGGTPVFSDLWHPTAAGFRVAAEIVVAALRSRGLVPVSAGAGSPQPADGAPDVASPAAMPGPARGR